MVYPVMVLHLNHTALYFQIMMRNGVITFFSEDSTDNLETTKMIERKSTCEDKLSLKKCKKLKKKNGGNGCKNKTTKKKCKKTCELCDDGKFILIKLLFIWTKKKLSNIFSLYFEPILIQGIHSYTGAKKYWHPHYINTIEMRSFWMGIEDLKSPARLLDRLTKEV